MAGRSSAGQPGYIAAIDERPGRGHVGSARASRVSPQREPAIAHGDCSRARVREAQGRVILLERGLDRSRQFRAAGTGRMSRQRYEELRRLASSLRVIK